MDEQQTTTHETSADQPGQKSAWPPPAPDSPAPSWRDSTGTPDSPPRKSRSLSREAAPDDEEELPAQT